MYILVAFLAQTHRLHRVVNSEDTPIEPRTLHADIVQEY